MSKKLTEEEKYIKKLEDDNHLLRRQCVELGKLANKRHKQYYRLLLEKFGRHDIVI